jgi:hypothetical protein
MMGAEYEYSVVVWGETCPVYIHQRTETVWIARGKYMAEWIETKGSSASSALNAWKETVSYKDNL